MSGVVISAEIRLPPQAFSCDCLYCPLSYIAWTIDFLSVNHIYEVCLETDPPRISLVDRISFENLIVKEYSFVNPDTHTVLDGARRFDLLVTKPDAGQIESADSFTIKLQVFGDGDIMYRFLLKNKVTGSTSADEDKSTWAWRPLSVLRHRLRAKVDQSSTV